VLAIIGLVVFSNCSKHQEHPLFPEFPEHAEYPEHPEFPEHPEHPDCTHPKTEPNGYFDVNVSQDGRSINNHYTLSVFVSPGFIETLFDTTFKIKISQLVNVQIPYRGYTAETHQVISSMDGSNGEMYWRYVETN